MAIVKKDVYDRNLPFTRLNSPSDSMVNELEKLDGNGHVRGTRRPGDFVVRSPMDLIRRKLARMTPSWTTTRGPLEGDAEKACAQEIQGTLVKSFQTWTDAPPLPWHWWYDWNFHLQPDVLYDWLRGRGNNPAPPTGPRPDEVPDSSHSILGGIPIIGGILGNLSDRIFGGPFGRNQFTVPGSVMECEWDAGVMKSGADRDTHFSRPGPMFEAVGAVGSTPGPEWAWPMSGHRVWLLGRSIYDGGHETEAGLCRSELHPVKAVAWARFEAFKFKENKDKYVPAIQFMFFTSRYGGYFDYPDIKSLDGKPYEFIVDLPEAPDDGPTEVAIADSSNVNLNTIALRKRVLLHDFDKDRFTSVARWDVAPSTVDPIIELLETPPDPSKPRRRQAKITIPVEALTGDCYGVLISLGWRDYSGELAKKVRKCTVKWENLHKYAINHNIFSEKWRFKAAVNGRWFQWEFSGVHNNSDHALDKELPPIYLSDDDKLEFTSHGAVLNKVDGVFTGALLGFDGSDGDRTVKISPADVFEEEQPATPLDVILGTIFTPLELLAVLGGAFFDGPQGAAPDIGARIPVSYKRHVDIRPPKLTGDNVATQDKMYPVQRAVARRIVTLMTNTLNDQNGPIGIIDGTPDPLVDGSTDPLVAGSADALFDRGPKKERQKDGVGAGNPLRLKKIPPDGKPIPITLTAYETWELGDSAELVERPHLEDADASFTDWKDYHINLTVKVEPQ